MTAVSTVADAHVEVWSDPVQWDVPAPPEISVSAEAPKGVPSSVPVGQLYYWTHKWQADQEESEQQLRNGNSHIFASGELAVKWLLTSTGDD